MLSNKEQNDISRFISFLRFPATVGVVVNHGGVEKLFRVSILISICLLQLSLTILYIAVAESACRCSSLSQAICFS